MRSNTIITVFLAKLIVKADFRHDTKWFLVISLNWWILNRRTWARASCVCADAMQAFAARSLFVRCSFAARSLHDDRPTRVQIHRYALEHMVWQSERENICCMCVRKFTMLCSIETLADCHGTLCVAAECSVHMTAERMTCTMLRVLRTNRPFL